MAEAVISFAVEKISQMVTEEARNLCGVREQVDRLRKELDRMRAVLKDADARQPESERVRQFIREMKEVAYEIEDVLETYTVKVALKRKRAFKNVLKRFACILSEAKFILKVRSEIDKIISKVTNMRASLQTCSIMAPTAETGSSKTSNKGQAQLRRTFSHVVEQMVVGMEGDVVTLVNWLVKEENPINLISIQGMGGLGKTTLARTVYYFPDLRKHFDCFAWEFISPEFKTRDVWEEILIQLTSPTKDEREEIRILTFAQLAKKLCQVQREKKCLIVLDDIWSPHDWGKLSAAFQIQNTFSKIILTTRNEKTARCTNLRSYIHQQHHLIADESWELLCSIITSRQLDKECRMNPTMELLGREMLKHCSGLPLAIKALGGVLASKDNISEWVNVCDNIIMHITQGDGSPQVMEVIEVLALSYDDLPYFLKPCFLYLSQFPGDYEIPVEKLINMWIAEGILLPLHYEGLGEVTVEDFGEHCVEELVQRCMVQVGKKDLSGRIKTCYLHDLMRDLCSYKAKEERFIQILDKRDKTEQLEFEYEGKIHRLALWVGKSAASIVPWQELMHPHIRSLFYINSKEYCEVYDFGWRSIKSVFESLKLLRVLNLEGIEALTSEVKLPVQTGSLIHLKFLSIRNTNVTTIPQSIENLRFLLTLDLRSRETVEIPNVIWKMQELRHLYFPKNCYSRNSEIRLPLRKLQTLVYVPLKAINRTKDEGKWDTLKKLVVHKPECYQGIAKILTLERKSPQMLTTLTLKDTKIEDNPMAVLEKLPSLRILKLWRDAFIGKEIVCSSGGFPRLTTLSLGNLSNLENIRIRDTAMPNLCHLIIMYCNNFKTIPEGLRFLTVLQRLCIITDPRVVEGLMQRISEGGEDFCNVQHVKFCDIRCS